MITVKESELKNSIQKLQQAYTRTFEINSPFVQAVLDDLANFCRANETTFHADPRVHAVLEGRRETWLRIKNHLEMDQEQLLKLYTFHTKK